MKSPENILYVAEEAAVDQTAAMARALSFAQSNQARLSVLSVLPKPRMGLFAGELKLADVEARIMKREYQRLERLLAPHRRGSMEIATEVRFGIPFIEVVREVLVSKCDLVIKAAGDGGAHEFLFGGADQHLLRKCPCPVWILYRETAAKYRRIVAAVDLDPWGEAAEDNGLNELILDWAGSLALSEFAELHIVHAWESLTEHMPVMFSSDLSDAQKAKNVARERRAYHEALAALASGLRDSLGTEAHGYLSPRLHLREGSPRKVVPEVAVELGADLIVMGTLSRTGIPGYFIGNTAEVILNNVECSVLAIKPDGFVSPVTIAR